MKKRIVRAIGAAAVVCLVIWCLWGNTALTVTPVEVFGGRLPRSFDGYRIVQLSDLHDARFGAQNERLIERVAAQQPSAIVLTGDMIDSRRTKVEPTVALAKRLVELAPVYYVTGNHEARIPEAAQALLDGLTRAGVTVLRSEAVDLQEGGESIRLIGLDDLGVYYQALSGDSSHRQALSAAKEALKQKVASGTTEEIKAGIEELNKALYAISEKLYQHAQQQNGSENAQGGATQNDDGTINADFNDK